MGNIVDLNQQHDSLHSGVNHSTSVQHALSLFKAQVEAHFGDNLKGLYLFGSYARGEAHDESDVDVAVILAQFGENHIDIDKKLVKLTLDILLETGIFISPLKLLESQWLMQDSHINPRLVLNIKKNYEVL